MVALRCHLDADSVYHERRCNLFDVQCLFRILHSNGFTQDELIKQRLVVYENTIHAMDTILQAMKHYGVKFTDLARKVIFRQY